MPNSAHPFKAYKQNLGCSYQIHIAVYRTRAQGYTKLCWEKRKKKMVFWPGSRQLLVPDTTAGTGNRSAEARVDKHSASDDHGSQTNALQGLRNQRLQIPLFRLSDRVVGLTPPTRPESHEINSFLHSCSVACYKKHKGTLNFLATSDLSRPKLMNIHRDLRDPLNISVVIIIGGSTTTTTRCGGSRDRRHYRNPPAQAGL